jgi:hypothetical protein
MRKRPFYVGDRLDCYVDARQKTMHLLGRWQCTQAERIEIFHVYASGASPVEVVIAGALLSMAEKNLLAWRDGFRSQGTEHRPKGCFDEMVAFWRATHGRRPQRYAPRMIAFDGQIIHWRFDATALASARPLLQEVARLA